MSDAQTDVAALVERLREGLGGISTHMMRGDNLAILLCTFFENPDEVADDDFGWTPSAITGYEQVCDAIHAHYKPHLESQARELAEAKLRVGLIDRYIKNQIEMQSDPMVVGLGDEASTLLHQTKNILGWSERTAEATQSELAEARRERDELRAAVKMFVGECPSDEGGPYPFEGMGTGELRELDRIVQTEGIKPNG